MILTVADFADRLLETPNVFGIVTFSTESSCSNFLTRFSGALVGRQNATISTVSAEGMSHTELASTVVEAIAKTDPKVTILILTGIEPMLPQGAIVLNGLREKLAVCMAVLIVLRRDRLRDFQVHAPDLMSLVGTFFLRAEAVGAASSSSGCAGR
jgi:hypothetical protein